MARILGALVVLFAVAPAAASASPFLAYTCGDRYASICRANADGGSPQTIYAGDFDANRRFGSPSLSADGRLMAYNLSGELHVRNLVSGAESGEFQIPNAPTVVRLRSDGVRVAAGESNSTFTRTELCSYNSDRSGNNEGRNCVAGGISGFDWAPGNRLVASISGGTTNNGREKICLLLPEGAPQTGCERDAARNPDVHLRTPAVSPDGRTVAVTEVADDGIFGSIALYDTATAARLRTVTSSGTDTTPVWAPDGSAIAFARGPSGSESVWIWDAESGMERRVIAAGRGPSWADSPQAPLSRLSARSRQRLRSVKGSVVVEQDGSKFSAELRSGSRGLGITSRPVDSGTHRFQVRLNFRGRSIVRDRGRLRVRLIVTVEPPGGAPRTLRRTVVVTP